MCERSRSVGSIDNDMNPPRKKRGVIERKRSDRLTVAASAIARLVSWPVSPTRVVIIPNLHVLMKVVNSSTFSFSGISSLAFVVYGSAGLPEVDMLLVFGVGLA